MSNAQAVKRRQEEDPDQEPLVDEVISINSGDFNV